MPTLLLKLVGPMQSWGIASRFDHRDTGKEPSKSGVVGLLAAALGIDRANWTELEPLTRLSMGVRHDRTGHPRRDYQTAKDVISADGKKRHSTAVTIREYLADAAFLVGVEGGDVSLLRRIELALRDPGWPLYLGRKSYVPSEPVWVDGGVSDQPLRLALSRHRWIARRRRWEGQPAQLLVTFESTEGSGALRMDQPLSSFAERRYGARYLTSEWIPFPGAGDAAA